MGAKDIYNRETLQAWLEARPDEMCISEASTIAQRAALRVLPVWLGETKQLPSRNRALPLLPLLRLMLVSGIGRNYQLDGFLKPADEVVAAIQEVARNDRAPKISSVAAAAVRANYSSISASTYGAIRNALSAVENASYASGHVVADAIWHAARIDALAIEEQQDIQRTPLWPQDPPKDLLIDELAGLEALATETGDRNSFWHRWWFAIKRGEPLNWDLQREVALIPNGIWDAGPKAVMQEIARIEERFALAASDNAEVIEQNPETGKLHLVPTSSLPVDLGNFARRKMVRAVELFDDPALMQQYGAIKPDLDMLRRAEAEAGTSPIELYDACLSATRRLAVRAAGGECPHPEKDALLEDYRNRLVDVAADILAHDPMTQDVLDRRNRIKGNAALIDAAGMVTRAVEVVLPATEGRLAATLPLDAKLATDPNADPEERKVASVRFSGRMLRIIAWAKEHPVLATGSAVVGHQIVVRATDWVIDAGGPQGVETLKAVWSIILKYLGL
jgi:hypothetical protein